jgi:hypothetical protein
MWTYGMQLWGTAFTTNIEILERLQSKALGTLVDALWYVPNTVIRHYSSQYSALLNAHPNNLTSWSKQTKQTIAKTPAK